MDIPAVTCLAVMGARGAVRMRADDSVRPETAHATRVAVAIPSGEGPGAGASAEPGDPLSHGALPRGMTVAGAAAVVPADRAVYHG